MQVALVLFTPTLTRIGSTTYALNHHRPEAYYIMALKTRVKARKSNLDHIPHQRDRAPGGRRPYASIPSEGLLVLKRRFELPTPAPRKGVGSHLAGRGVLSG